ncbi:hypothetical protein Vretimale_12254 [Volvox reticuliferus]|uniref:E3 UFM1-protein ligase 1 homolog n=1 Tax=Volvox reticuliferus TaxID=1737510 RepID=A0A8J4GI72_9CHLO|nr:hypothetical protein Vretimale_12254 [Volvox reticuliferus]
MQAALGLDLSSLLTQLAATQHVQSSAKLSERNVVELINKLRQLSILSEGELLHTLNGKEYLTVDCLRSEIQNALRQAGGRLSLVELPTIVGVDLVHCERQAAVIVAESGSTVLEIQGELITAQYFDTIAAEINDQLQETGQISIGELAAQYGLATELVLNVVSSKLGSAIDGRLEGGLLYTQSYLRAIKAQLRGALRAASSPALVLALLRDAGLGTTGDAPAAAMGGGLAAALAGSAGGGVIATLIEELVQERALRGALKGGGTSWAPAVYGEVQQEAVANFYSQNGWVAYDTVRRLGISNERAYLRSTFPDGLPLESAFVAPSLLATLEAAVDEVATAATAAAGGSAAGCGWVDLGPLLPSILSEADVAALLGRVPLLREQERRPIKERKVHVIGGAWVLSGALLAALQEKADAEARVMAHKALQERKASGGAAATAGAGGRVSGGPTGAGGGKKKGAVAAADDDDDDDWSMGQGKKGGKGRKGGGGKGGSGKASGSASGSKDAKSAATVGGDGSGAAGVGLTALALAAKLREWSPDMGWGDDEDDKAAAMAQLLLPGAMGSYEEALQVAFTAGAEERRRAKDSIARQFEDSYSRLLLYGAGGESFADDEATHTALQRHALRTAGAECADLLHRWARIEYQQEATEHSASATAGPSAGAGSGSGFLTAAEVKQVLRSVPLDVAEGLAAAAEVPGAATVRDAEVLLDRAAAAVGVRVKKLDKKGEKAALAALRERLLSSLAAELDPPAALAIMVPLAHLRIIGKAIILPGKALGPVLSRLQQASAEGSELSAVVRGLAELHEGVVEYLKAQSAGSGTAADRGAMLEHLTGMLQPLKSALGLRTPSEQ